MDKLRKYQGILTQYLSDFAKQPPYANMPDVKTTVLIDLKGNHFQAVDIGWAGAKYIFSPVFHFDIKHEKIWFQCNNTDREVIDELVEMGVENNDIILGFQPPYVRSRVAEYILA
jgi:XisI protein